MTHQEISYIKSTIRIAGYCALLINFTIAALILVVSELVGIAEEIGEE